jgi:hypothetical protein
LTDRLTDAELRLLEELSDAARGPIRDGTFALWLLVRYCDGMLPPDPLSDRIARRRFEQLERRLSSLSLSPPLRRGMMGALRELRTGHADGVSLALHQLVAPSRDALGAAAADALFLAAGLAREASQEMNQEP